MNLYTVHQKTKQKVTSAVRSQTNNDVFSSCFSCPKSTSDCHRVMGRLFQTGGPATEKTSVVQSSVGRRDDVDVGVSRTNMTVIIIIIRRCLNTGSDSAQYCLGPGGCLVEWSLE